jgi:glycosyltransferase involved in cell wall biosynthesis
MLRILMLHNRYRLAGGEDDSVSAEVAMLRSRGHDVELLVRDNRAHDLDSAIGKVRVGLSALGSGEAAATVKQAIRDFRPDILHCQNLFPLWSPSVLPAAHELGVPTVAHIRNYRLFCLEPALRRNGRPCEACIGTLPWRGVVHRCYRGSILGSAVVAASIAAHRAAGTWERHVDAFIAPSEHTRSLLIAGGLRPDQIHVKPNFVGSTSASRRAQGARRGAAFAGRLSAEKGIEALCRAWRRLEPNLYVAGDGPLRQSLMRGAPGNVHFLGRLSTGDLHQLLSSVEFVVVPSECYETFGRSVIDAYAARAPVLGASIGAIPELVEEGVTGLLFRPGVEEDLAGKARWLFEHPDEALAMGERACLLQQAQFSPEANYPQLIAVYEAARAVRARAER